MVTTAKNKRSENRALLEMANKQFPDRDAGFKIAPGNGYAAEVASLRSARDAGRNLAEMTGFNWMQDCNRRRILSDTEIARSNSFDWRNNEKDRNELAALIKLSETSSEKAKELAQYRQFVVTSDLLAMPFALGAFQSINLSADEMAQIITPKARQYFNVRYLGQDGGARQDQWRTTRKALEIEMRALSTDKVEYSLIDLQQGDVNEFDKINSQLRYDMEMKIDTLALANLNANKTTSGLKALLNIGPLVDQSNIPDSNYLDLTDTGTYGTAHTVTIARLKAVLGRLAQWGFGLDPDGPIRIKSMIMSPMNARDSWDYVDLIANWNAPAPLETHPQNTITEQQREAIYAGGSMMNSAWGYQWENQYNTQIAAGRMYVLTNLPIGWYFTKTDFDRTIEWKDTPDAIEQNIGQVMMRRAVQFYQPALWAYRYLIVDF